MARIPVVFDLDGTLIDSLPDIAWAVNEVLREDRLPALTEQTVGGFVGRGERVLVMRLIEATDLSMGDFDTVLARFLGHYRKATHRTRMMPGAREVLEELAGEGVPLGLCTNKPDGPLQAVLQALDLTDTFGAVIAGDILPSRKPDPAMLHWVMDRLGAETCLYVGDSEVDAETAQRAGVPFAFYTEGIRGIDVSDMPHDFRFSDFSAFSALYQTFLNRS